MYIRKKEQKKSGKFQNIEKKTKLYKHNLIDNFNENITLTFNLYGHEIILGWLKDFFCYGWLVDLQICYTVCTCIHTHSIFLNIISYLENLAVLTSLKFKLFYSFDFSYLNTFIKKKHSYNKILYVTVTNL